MSEKVLRNEGSSPLDMNANRAWQSPNLKMRGQKTIRLTW